MDGDKRDYAIDIAKRKVIEAAKAFVETTGGGKAYIAEWWRLKEAIEALQEAER